MPGLAGFFMRKMRMKPRRREHAEIADGADRGRARISGPAGHGRDDRHPGGAGEVEYQPGETYQRIELLRALLVKSPNDVARCLARDQAGSIEAFAAIMNEKARELGATHSHFVNPNGLPVPTNIRARAISP